MIFNANSIWNKPIGDNPTIKGEFSATLSRQPKVGINGVTDFGIPVWDVDASTPRVTVVNEPGHSEIIPVPPGIIASPISDGFLIIRDIGAGRAYSAWRWTPNGDGTYTGQSMASHNIGPTGNGFTTFWAGNPWDGNVGYLAGHILLDELKSGVIDHALSIAFDADMVNKSLITWPSGMTSDGHATDPLSLQYGQRIQLDPNLNLDTLG
ncbi:MAG: hypothetical protein Q8P59_06810, partial [Dehalococcoidia bacterium]|nr:hypothetical protein [Dehalococcoidia bacterium]